LIRPLAANSVSAAMHVIPPVALPIRWATAEFARKGPPVHGTSPWSWGRRRCGRAQRRVTSRPKYS
jgi:hypothetical protein